MKEFAAVAVLLVFAYEPVAAQVDWRQTLRSDKVEISDGNFIYTETGVMTLSVPGHEETTVQYQINSRAPNSGVISRDNFVAMTSQVAALLPMRAFADAYEVTVVEYLEGVDIQKTAELIGNPDLLLNLHMTGEGLQFEFIGNPDLLLNLHMTGEGLQFEFIGADGEPMRFTQTWQQVYGTP